VLTRRHVEARTGAYADSVTLMQISAQVEALDGVHAALVAMATELNLGLLRDLGFDAPTGGGQHDLLVAIGAADDDSLARALAAVDDGLRSRPSEEGSGSAGPGAVSPRTTLSAARRAGPGLCLISVPGPHAFTEAMDALDAGCDVMIFSDNVPVEQEIILKDVAAGRGLLVMGPDCGTAIVGGLGLGFSHRLPSGPIGVVAASGTGAQQLACLLDAAAEGVAAVLGVGGRDLSAAVGGRSAMTALAALDADPRCELIVLLSKPPAPEVAERLRVYARTLATPVQFAMVGLGQPDLTAAAEAALTAIGRLVPDWPTWPGAAGSDRGPADRNPAGRALRGLFAGGTLCDEAMVIAAERLGPVWSNVPLRPQWRIDPRVPARQAMTGPGTAVADGARHTMLDFGDDELTAGRPHPMIDQRLRLDRLAAEAADPDTGVIMLDVVLGHGAHPDPAAELAPGIAAARAGRDLPVVVSLIGARSDPQGLPGQAAALAAAGARVFASNAVAARHACGLIEALNARRAGGRP
jgi:FdrA protein